MTLSDEPDRGSEQVSSRPEEHGKSGGILLQGNLLKLKRMKKKFFILFDGNENTPSRLEYFDTEKKWKHGQSPKRSIIIKDCFNISRRSDCKQKLVLGLYTRDDCFSVAFETEAELERWFCTLLEIQLEGQISEGEELKPIYDHVWQVTVRNKELASRKNIVGPHRLCLTSRVLKLVKMPMTCPSGGTNPVDLNSPDLWEFPLMNIRRCGYKNCHFFMELGRGSVTGAGELWMEADEAATAQSMHAMIVDAMRNCAKEDLGPRTRTRSSSASEQNRPTNLTNWSNPPSASSSIRSRADSVPSQQSQPYRTRTISDGIVATEASNRQSESSGRALSAYLDASPPTMSSPAGSLGLYLNDSAASSFSNDDYDHHLGLQTSAEGSRVAAHGIHGHRFSHTATPENSLPKESTILEEGSAYPDYLSMTIMDGTPNDTSAVTDYLSMTPRAGMLSSSPSARSISSTLGRSGSSATPSGGMQRPIKSRPSFSSPPIKPTLLQNPYMEMTSPVAPPTSSWSPPNSADNNDSYMPMQPGTRSGTHTRSSSFGEDVPDGYVPMAPQSVASSLASRDGHLDEPGLYMDMTRWNTNSAANYRRSVPRDVGYGTRGRLSPASSSSLASSMTSGTPSVPFGTPPLSSGVPGRFNEFHLEKVASLLTPSEDDDEVSSLRCRQSRAYSVGSRPELAASRRVLAAKMEAGAGAQGSAAHGSATSAAPDTSARVRAYSVGSRVAAANVTNGQLSADSSLNSSRHEVGAASGSSGGPAPSGASADEAQRKKSLSVPTLGSSPVSVSWSNPTGTFLRNLLSSRRENDLMEIEFAGGAIPEAGAKGNYATGHYTSNDSLVGSSSVAGLDHTDGHGRPTDLSYLAAFGSSDSVGRASVSSTNSGGGRPRPSSRSSSVLSGRAGGGVSASSKAPGSKLQRERGSKGGRPELERLESVPQGRDQDYIEYGESKPFVASPDESPSVATASRPASSSSKNAASRKGEANDSADEYVELARPSSAQASRKSASRSSVPRVSVTESEGSASQRSPVSDYMAMDFSRATPPAASTPVARQTRGRDADAAPLASNGEAGGYMDMTYPSGKQTPSSHPASVSDGESYLPMDFTPTPTPKSSRNPSRQSSQVDLGLALAALSPARGLASGAQTPRSGSQSARHSRTEETLQEHYMEMTFNHSESSQSLRGSEKSVRARGPSPYGKSESDASGALTDSEANSGQKGGTANRATAFLSNLLGRKSSSAAKSPPSAAEASGTLPRSSRSMPPSPFSSLKRPKSSKKRRSATANQSTPPVSPDLDHPLSGYHHQRSSSLRSSGCTRPTALVSVSSVTSRSLCSPLTPPSPGTDLGRMPSQFSPPLSASASGAASSRPGSTQPISIALQRPASSFTPRGSPVSGPDFYRRNLGMRTPDPDEYVLPPPQPAASIGRYSTSPGRAFAVPTLSPLPEVNSVGPYQDSSGSSGQPSSKKKKSSAPQSDASSYVNMSFGSKVDNVQVARALPAGPPLPLPPPPSPVKTTPATSDARKSIAAVHAASHPVPSAAPVAAAPVAAAPVPATPALAPVPSPALAPAPVPYPAPAPAPVAPVVTTPAKQRANSLEKIVGALEKVKIGPKRHSSGDKPLKRPSGTLIYRSNSYQPTGNRVVVAGSGKSASVFPLLSEIPAGKMIASASSSSVTASGSEAGGFQLSAAPGGKNSVKSPSHQTLCTNRTSSSSLASLGEELGLNAEMQSVPWADGGSHSSISASPGLFSTATNSSSPSSSLSSSRPTSVLGNDKEILYAQLDLPPAAAAFRPAEEADEVPKSPRLRPNSAAGFAEALACTPAPSATTYVQIDFKKSEGLKSQPRV